MDFSNNIWVEKYTPKTIEDICLPNHCVENDEVCNLEEKIFLADKTLIKNIISKPYEVQDMLFFSQSPGTGKTATFELIGKLIGARTKYINASLFDDESVIKKEVITFSQYSSFKSDNVPKLIILDEISEAKQGFQEALKATFSAVSKTARMCLAANDYYNIIDPLKSRCVKVDFSHSNPNYVTEIKNQMVSRLETICKLENVEYSLDFLNQLVESNYPDFRTALNSAQMIKNLAGKLVSTNELAKTLIYNKVLEALDAGNYAKARSEHLKLQLSVNIFPIALKHFTEAKIDPIKKLEIISAIGDCNNYHSQCACKEVNIAYMFSRICLVILRK